MDIRSVDLLYRARDLVGQGWTQHADARAADGASVHPWNDAAVEWSLLGAIVAALEELADDDRDLPLVHLALALDELALHVDDDSLARWNDLSSRTQADVERVLDVAARSRAEKVHEPPARSDN